ncbi:nickel-dependent lactate racemase [Halarsenatibacter silvermanii]|uniref:Nickel-dependent lactate racemase n=1 Tax=Halarsenatibacter silvermanii TaxID=321763 RepID=A0A1G9MD23_9FIRM|nr:nickel-dependent lactate racemase [Halarsenatibacter silvermanii]SDL72172.1 Nickel-dependent lactate racemase [Halarsenatibacter silvermanii]
MKFEIGYGRESLSFNLDSHNLAGELTPKKFDVSLTEKQEIEQALAGPVDSDKLSEIVSPGEEVVIITSDITRPLPSYKILPTVLRELDRGGVKDEDIQIVFATGIHRGHSQNEQQELVGKNIYERVECIDKDEDGCVNIGETEAGTPVDIFEPVVRADRVICLGNVEYHYFAGYSGGAKAVMPGVSTADAIENNHSMMVSEKSASGRMEDNPVREDIEEIKDFLHIDFIVNVVLDEEKRIVKAAAGDPVNAHRVCCDYLDRHYRIKISDPADTVVVSPGGHPKDLNLYQAQKALDNASRAVKEGGTIILAASCSEGLGEETFANWMEESDSPEEIIEKIQQDFQLGGHKAAAIAMVLERCEVILVSDMGDDYTESIFFTAAESISEALEMAYKKAEAEESEVLIMPSGGSTLPVIDGEED